MSVPVKEYLDLSKEDRELASKPVTMLDLKHFELESRDDSAKDGAELTEGLGELSERIETQAKRLTVLTEKLDDPRGYDRQIERAESRLSDRIDKLDEKLVLIVDRVIQMDHRLADELETLTPIPVDASTVTVEGEVS